MAAIPARRRYSSTTPHPAPWLSRRGSLEGWRGVRGAEEGAAEFAEPVLDRAGVLPGHLAHVGRYRVGAAVPDPVELLQPGFDLPGRQAAGQPLLPGALLRQVAVGDLTREDGRDPRGDVTVTERLRPGQNVRGRLVPEAGEHPRGDVGDVAGSNEADLALARRRIDHAFLADTLRRGQQVLHVLARCQVAGRQAGGRQVHGDLP